MSYSFANYANPAPAQLPTDFTIRAQSDTDLWDKPPSTHSFSCPILYQTISTSTFKKARVAVSADWKDKYDQGGLVLVRGKGNGKDVENPKWVKVGVEFFEGAPHISVVARDNWSDWSLRPMRAEGSVGATIELSKEKDGALWVYLLEGVQRSPLREITWFFEGAESESCWVGVYAAKPSKTGSELEVSFSHLVVDTE